MKDILILPCLSFSPLVHRYVVDRISRQPPLLSLSLSLVLPFTTSQSSGAKILDVRNFGTPSPAQPRRGRDIPPPLLKGSLDPSSPLAGYPFNRSSKSTKPR